MAYRQIDSQGAWKGELRALQGFKSAFEIDCNGNAEIFQQAYGWTSEAIALAKSRIIDKPTA